MLGGLGEADRAGAGGDSYGRGLVLIRGCERVPP
jgi:hypothetical protein